jgi:hypothetical protein
MTTPQGVHLVGSMNFPDAESTFRTTAAILGDRLKRIPDGEVGERALWITFQAALIARIPGVTRFGDTPILVGGNDMRTLTFNDLDLTTLTLGPLGYAAAALDSWNRFSALREEGVIPAGTRFQVSLPTPAAVVGGHVAPQDRAAFEPIYAAALFEELDQILAAVPHDSLAIQWDTAVEFGFIENSGYGGPFIPWFDDVWGGVIDRATEQASLVPDDVQLGYHFCYGDAGEEHFVEPVDTANLAKFGNLLLAASPRHIDWIHLPVPISRDDDAYFAPLDDLDLTDGTELYLGLVHRQDGAEGARRRIDAAAQHAPRFGVATECGFGRAPVDSTVPLLETHKAVSAAW